MASDAFTPLFTSAHAADGTFRWADDASAERFGLAPEALRGRSLFDLVHPDDAPRLREHASRVADGHDADPVTVRLAAADADLVEVRLRARRGQDGALDELVAAMRTADSSAEGTGAPGPMLHRVLLDASEEFIGLVALDRRLLLSNRAFGGRLLRAFGLRARAGLDLREVARALGEAAHARLSDAFDAAAGGSRTSVEVGVDFPDAGAATLRGSVFPVFDAGRVASVAFVLRDAGPGVSDEAGRGALVERAARAVPDLLYVLDAAAQRLLYANRPVADLLGLDPAEADADALVDAFVHADDRAELERHRRHLAAAAAGDVVETELRLVRPDGEARWVRLRDRVGERGPDGQPVQVFGLVQDVTEAHRAEASLAHLNRALQEVNDALRQRAAELDEARRAAEQAVAAKAAFFDTVSHEMRTPLNGILGMAEVLSGMPSASLTDEQAECVETIRTSGQALLALVDDVLGASQLEAGDETVEAAPFDLHALAREAADAARATIPPGFNLAVGLVVEAGVSQAVVGDAPRLRQVLDRLLSNAVKFTPAGAVELRLVPKPGGRTGVRVSDTGIGIAPELRERLFRPFTQADASTTRKFGGMGLGLSIAQRLVQLMGGEIAVESTPGEGASFSFDLLLPTPIAAAAARPPRRRDDDASPEAFPAPGVAEADPDMVPAHFDGLGVLLVEDSVVNQKVAVRLLERMGVLADVTNNGQEALDAMQARPYEVVLMDLVMPIMNGIDAARAIRALPLDVQPFIAAVTTSPREEDVVASREAGMDAFLAKPVTLASLGGVLQMAVDRLGGD